MASSSPSRLASWSGLSSETGLSPCASVNGYSSWRQLADLETEKAQQMQQQYFMKQQMQLEAAWRSEMAEQQMRYEANTAALISQVEQLQALLANHLQSAAVEQELRAKLETSEAQLAETSLALEAAVADAAASFEAGGYPPKDPAPPQTEVIAQQLGRGNAKEESGSCHQELAAALQREQALTREVEALQGQLAKASLLSPTSYARAATQADQSETPNAGECERPGAPPADAKFAARREICDQLATALQAKLLPALSMMQQAPKQAEEVKGGQKLQSSLLSESRVELLRRELLAELHLKGSGSAWHPLGVVVLLADLVAAMAEERQEHRPQAEKEASKLLVGLRGAAARSVRLLKLLHRRAAETSKRSCEARRQSSPSAGPSWARPRSAAAAAGDQLSSSMPSLMVSSSRAATPRGEGSARRGRAQGPIRSLRPRSGSTQDGVSPRRKATRSCTACAERGGDGATTMSLEGEIAALELIMLELQESVHEVEALVCIGKHPPAMM